MREVTYAGTQWEVIYEGEKVLHLRSLRDRKLIIHCSTKSEYLSEETKHNSSGEIGIGEVNIVEKPEPKRNSDT